MHRRFVSLIVPLLVVVCVVSTTPSYAQSVALQQTTTPDSDLKPGFPVTTPFGSCHYWVGPRANSLVGNIDADPQLEIVAAGLCGNPLYAWNADGSVVPGWPVSDDSSGVYPSLGNLSVQSPGMEVFAGYLSRSSQPSVLSAYAGTGQRLPGWPRTSSNYVHTPAALADVNGDGRDEIFIGEEDWLLHAYQGDGTPLPGWPVNGGHPPATDIGPLPAIADLDGDGDLEILSAKPIEIVSSAGVVHKILLAAYHHDGKPMAGYPTEVVVPNNQFQLYPAIGDIDGDGLPEIVVVARQQQDPWHPIVYVLSATGAVERTMVAAHENDQSGTVALADLDGDRVPEIVFQAGRWLNAWHGDGTVVTGWPRRTWEDPWIGSRLGSSAPVVGDVDGDQQPDIVVTVGKGSSSEDGYVLVYDRHGNLHPRFPKELPIGGGAVPAIADIDLDGRNDIIIAGDFLTGDTTGAHGKVWVYDLGGPPHGRIEWGQFQGGPQHQGVYVPSHAPRGAHVLYVPRVQR